MASQVTVSELLSRNKALALNHEPIPTLEELSKMEPQTHIAVVTCADPRCNPDYFLGLKPTDGILYFRNVNGHVGPVLNDIIALDHLVKFDEIMIVHHTDCGATHFTDEAVRAGLKQRYPNDKEIDSMLFGAVSNIVQSVKEDLAILKASPYIRKELADRTVGFVYDIKTGLLSPVEG